MAGRTKLGRGAGRSGETVRADTAVRSDNAVRSDDTAPLEPSDGPRRVWGALETMDDGFAAAVLTDLGAGIDRRAGALDAVFRAAVERASVVRAMRYPGRCCGGPPS